MPPYYHQAFLLVDGYNVIGAWSDLKVIRDRDGLEAARHQLTESLVNYSAFKGFETQVVFDAHYQNTPANSEVLTSHLSVYYTDFQQTADTYIEKTCANYQRQPRVARLIVATSDRAQQQTVLGYGAEWLSALQLAHEVDSSIRRVRGKQQPKKQSRGRFLFNSLDAQSQKRLSDLRRGIH